MRMWAWIRETYWRTALFAALVFGLVAAGIQMLTLAAGADASGDGLTGSQVYGLGALTFLVGFLSVAIVASLVSIIRRLVRT